MDFGTGKAGAFDLVCITDDQKGMGVDFHDNLIQEAISRRETTVIRTG